MPERPALSPRHLSPVPGAGVAASVCSCGHPYEAHDHIKGFECSAGVTIDGQTSVPDVWVCSGGRLVANPENASPWDFACGCILHDPPPED